MSRKNTQKQTRNGKAAPPKEPMYSVKNDKVSGPNVGKLFDDVKAHLKGRAYDRWTLGFNVSGVLCDAKRGEIPIPETHEAWVAAIVREFTVNDSAFKETLKGMTPTLYFTETGFGMRFTRPKKGGRKSA